MKPTVQWEPHAIIEWYELEVEKWKLEVLSVKIAKYGQVAVIGFLSGIGGAAVANLVMSWL